MAVTEAATKAAGFLGFKSSGSDNVFYAYKGVSTSIIDEYSTNDDYIVYTSYDTVQSAPLVTKWVIPGYTYSSSKTPINVVVPGTFPQFGWCMSSSPKSTFSNSFLQDYIDVELFSTDYVGDDGKGSSGITKYIKLLRTSSYLEVYTKISTDASYSLFAKYSPNQFKDGALPSVMYALLVGGGGGGAASSAAWGNNDGAGGAGGGAILIAFKLYLNVVTEISVGGGGSRGYHPLYSATTRDGGKGGNTVLSTGYGEDYAVIAYGGTGGVYASSSAASGGSVYAYVPFGWRTCLSASGGQGAGIYGGAEPGGVSARSYGIPGTFTSSSNKQNYLSFLSTSGGKWAAGQSTYCAPGGASLLADGGISGDNNGGSTTGDICGGNGSLGSGGGGARWYGVDSAVRYGGAGGTGVCLLFC